MNTNAVTDGNTNLKLITNPLEEIENRQGQHNSEDRNNLDQNDENHNVYNITVPEFNRESNVSNSPNNINNNTNHSNSLFSNGINLPFTGNQPTYYGNPLIYTYGQLPSQTTINNSEQGASTLIYTHSILVPCYQLVTTSNASNNKVKSFYDLYMNSDQTEEQKMNENSILNNKPKPSLVQNQINLKGDVTMTSMDSSNQAKFKVQDLKGSFKISLSYISNKVKLFPMLLNLLVKIFLNEEVNSDEANLNVIESMVFYQIVKRKFPNIVLHSKISETGNEVEILKIVEKIKLETSMKRLEENIKFVYKHAMKQIRKKFQQEVVSSSEMDVNESFFHFYFKEIADKNNLSSEVFKDPSNLKTKEKTKQLKTINSEYLNLIFKSDKLVNNVREVLKTNKLLKSYQNGVLRKFEKLFVRWEKDFTVDTSIHLIHNRIKNYLQYNKQCKLPWTSNEIIAAIEFFLANIPKNRI